MPVLQLNDQQFPLSAGPTRIGAGDGADIKVPGYSDLAIEAIIDGGPTPTIRRSEEAAHVRVNGVLLGAEPTPLMHGDKIELAGLELNFADDAKGGATQFVSAADIAALAGAKRAGAARATAASGGRLVSLVDGKEYAIPAGGVILGRDASADVVVPQSEVSRRHAEIVAADQGYMLKDLSANGLFVNGEKVNGQHLLSRADVVRIGTEEFRFYADVLPAGGTPPVGAPAVPQMPAAPKAAPPAQIAEPRKAEPEPSLTISAADSMMADLELLPVTPMAPPPPAPAPAAPVAPKAAEPVAPVAAAAKDSRQAIGELESLNGGPDKGRKYELRAALSHVGRGAHNDVSLNDESVSETHAKLQRREDGWYVVDMDSTNGTYVGGTRITGEKRLDGSPDLRFGGLKFRFTPLGTFDVEAKGTRTIAPVTRSTVAGEKQSTAKVPSPQTPPRSMPAAQPSPTPASAPTASGGGIPGWVWIVVALIVIGAVGFFMMKK